MKMPSLCYTLFESPVGTLYLIFSGRSLAKVTFEKPLDIAFKKGAASANFIKELALYFQGSNAGFSQQIRFLTGTDFERKIWLSLKEIPYGETRTYKWIAEKAGSPSATRAAGQALSKNPVPIVLPCHRVIESDGSVGGYSSGINMKIRLLELEYYSKMNKKRLIKALIFNLYIAINVFPVLKSTYSWQAKRVGNLSYSPLIKGGRGLFKKREDLRVCIQKH